MGSNDEELMEEQIRYYGARAPIYDQLYFREGRYAVDDPVWTANWQRETGELERFVHELPPDGSVLEIACGTGLWTRFLAPRASRMVALDASPQVLALNRERVGDQRIRYVEGDVFTWEQPEGFDLIFLGFFLSHVPPSRWAPLWERVRLWLAPGGAAAFVDDCWAPDRPAPEDRVVDGPDHAHIRRLDDASYTIVKRFFRPEEFVDELGEVGFAAEVRSTGEHFFFGTARPV